MSTVFVHEKTLPNGARWRMLQGNHDSVRQVTATGEAKMRGINPITCESLKGTTLPVTHLINVGGNLRSKLLPKLPPRPKPSSPASESPNGDASAAANAGKGDDDDYIEWYEKGILPSIEVSWQAMIDNLAPDEIVDPKILDKRVDFVRQTQQTQQEEKREEHDPKDEAADTPKDTPKDVTVLIVCKMGMNRSPTLTLLCLMQLEGFTLRNAYLRLYKANSTATQLALADCIRRGYNHHISVGRDCVVIGFEPLPAYRRMLARVDKDLFGKSSISDSAADVFAKHFTEMQSFEADDGIVAAVTEKLNSVLHLFARSEEGQWMPPDSKWSILPAEEACSQSNSNSGSSEAVAR